MTNMKLRFRAWFFQNVQELCWLCWNWLSLIFCSPKCKTWLQTHTLKNDQHRWVVGTDDLFQSSALSFSGKATLWGLTNSSSSRMVSLPVWIMVSLKTVLPNGTYHMQSQTPWNWHWMLLLCKGCKHHSLHGEDISTFFIVIYFFLWGGCSVFDCSG